VESGCQRKWLLERGSPAGGVPVTRHSRPAHCDARRWILGIGEIPALAGVLGVVAVLAGCASPATAGPPSASPAASPPPAASTPAVARMFTSRHYGYTDALPAGWTGAQATQQWDGTGAPGDQDSVVDLFQGPAGVEAWAIAVPTKQSLAAYARTTIRASAAAHPCPAVPQTNHAVTIGGAPARLLSMHCPPRGGLLVLIAITKHGGTAFVFASQHPYGTKADEPVNRTVFRNFLASVQFQR